MPKIVLGMVWLLSLASIARGQFESTFLLRPDRLFDGVQTHRNWSVLVRRDIIEVVGPDQGISAPTYARVIELPGMTLLPGLIEGHTHLLLHPYDETPWNDQVLKEPESYRVALATRHAEATLLAGFTTARDLGTEGAGYADLGLKRAIADGSIAGPRLLISSRAVVATGSYGPKGFAPHFRAPLGAQEADGVDVLVRVVRDQIGHGADWIKLYADYRWGPQAEPRPTFSEQELTLAVATAASSGRSVAAHATTSEAIRRAIVSGVTTIEHGSGGSEEDFALMAERGIALCPTLAATHAIARYRGWDPESDPEPDTLRRSRDSFRRARDSGVAICMGSDAGVFRHGENHRELELMVEYGMEPRDAVAAATSGNATILGLSDRLGSIRPGLLADLVAFAGDPTRDIRDLQQPRLVMKAGRIYLEP